MARLPAALADGAANVTYLVFFCCVLFIYLFIYLLYFEMEKRGITVIAMLQKYLLSFKYAQALVYFQCCGKSLSLDFKIKFYF